MPCSVTGSFRSPRTRQQSSWTAWAMSSCLDKHSVSGIGIHVLTKAPSILRKSPGRLPNARTTNSRSRNHQGRRAPGSPEAETHPRTATVSRAAADSAISKPNLEGSTGARSAARMNSAKSRSLALVWETFTKRGGGASPGETRSLEPLSVHPDMSPKRSDRRKYPVH